MSQFNLSITLGNAAMQYYDDIAGALHRVANRLPWEEGESGSIQDLNGNTVGKWEISYND